MTENDRLNDYLDEISLDFVEREATPKLLMKLSIQLHLSGLSLLILFFLEVSVLIELDPPFITGFTKPTYSRNLGGARITLRSMRR